MSKHIVIFSLFCFTATPNDGPIAHRLHAFLSGSDCPDFSGVVLVEVAEKIVFHRSYGHPDRAGKIAMSTDTPFCVASISKQFTAAAILKLAELGKLKVNDPVAKHLDGIPPDRAALTIHHLLCHMGGLGQNYAADGIRDRREAVRAVFKQPSSFPIGEKFSYSNDGYSLLAATVAQMSGQSFESWLTKNLLEPAGMAATSFWGSIDLDDPRQMAYIPSPGSGSWAQANWGFRGGTGMITTTGDLYLWVQALRQGKVLSKRSVESLWAEQTPISIGHAGYGWFRSKSPRGRSLLWTRGTEDFGHNALVLWFLEEEVLLILATNAGYIHDTSYAKYLGNALEPVLFPPGN